MPDKLPCKASDRRLVQPTLREARFWDWKLGPAKAHEKEKGQSRNAEYIHTFDDLCACLLSL
jgi:hypothetical protein